MIILDTNVLSELMKPSPAEAVLEWLSGQPAAALHVTSISYAEILFGIARLPDGKRRHSLAEQAHAMFQEDFAGRVLGFDALAAPHYAELASRRQREGRRIHAEDGMIAAIALLHGASIVSRDSDLSGCGVAVINPWTT